MENAEKGGKHLLNPSVVLSADEAMESGRGRKKWGGGEKEDQKRIPSWGGEYGGRCGGSGGQWKGGQKGYAGAHGNCWAVSR